MRRLWSLPGSVFVAIVMTTTRRFRADDLFRFNNVNLDVLTETYNNAFYLQYLATWPDYCVVQEAPGGRRLMGYILGKAEGEGKRWHGHVTAVTIAPEYRRLGCAQKVRPVCFNMASICVPQ